MNWEEAQPAAQEAILHLSHPRLGTGWFRFCKPREVLTAATVEEVVPVLKRAQAAADGGMFAVGFVSYEAARAFDGACQTHPPAALPLSWFALYDRPEPVLLPPPGRFAVPDWTADLGPDEYRHCVEQLREYIARGHTYQANFTFRLQASADVAPWDLFLAMNSLGGATYGAYVDIGAHVLCSASPELFFLRDGERVVCQPMKGTAPRGRSAAEDRAMASRLQASAKDRAENVMIVDMIRNDLGRVARPGTVHVQSLFDVTRYPTLYQMTSTVVAETNADVPALFAALFPCASVTGAPKIRTMQILREAESTPRGVYTGAIGVIAPQGCAQFSVAIRTLHVDRTRRLATYGTGSGIVWDSVADAEFAECRTKARILNAPRPDFRLLETLRWEADAGFFLLEGHLRRLRESADYFDFDLCEAAVREALMNHAAGWGSAPRRVRLLVARDGTPEVQAAELDGPRFAEQPDPSSPPLRMAWARRPVDRDDIFLYHKTTHRAAYDDRLRAQKGFGDLLLWNEQDELTETCIGNVVVRRGTKWITPPVECGLLPGVFRDDLLARGRICEQVVPRRDLAPGDEFYRINSVRGWTRLEVVKDSGGAGID